MISSHTRSKAFKITCSNENPKNETLDVPSAAAKGEEERLVVSQPSSPPSGCHYAVRQGEERPDCRMIAGIQEQSLPLIISSPLPSYVWLWHKVKDDQERFLHHGACRHLGSKFDVCQVTPICQHRHQQCAVEGGGHHKEHSRSKSPQPRLFSPPSRLTLWRR